MYACGYVCTNRNRAGLVSNECSLGTYLNSHKENFMVDKWHVPDDILFGPRMDRFRDAGIINHTSDYVGLVVSYGGILISVLPFVYQ